MRKHVAIFTSTQEAENYWAGGREKYQTVKNYFKMCKEMMNLKQT